MNSMVELNSDNDVKQCRFEDLELQGRPHSGGWTLAAVLIVWTLMVVGGLSILWRYEHTEGSIAQSPQQWPDDTPIHRSADCATILFFAHPQCPCTRASVDELARLMAASHGRAETFAIFMKPSEFSDQIDWEKTNLWYAAERIPGVKTLVDSDGTEAKRFHAQTSGIVLLYDQAGTLRFRGGITPSRGHNGDNLGRSAIVDFLQQGHAAVGSSKVYGCELGCSVNELDSACCPQ